MFWTVAFYIVDSFEYFFNKNPRRFFNVFDLICFIYYIFAISIIIFCPQVLQSFSARYDDVGFVMCLEKLQFGNGCEHCFDLFNVQRNETCKNLPIKFQFFWYLEIFQ